MSEHLPQNTQLHVQSGCSHEGLISLDLALQHYLQVEALPIIRLPLIQALRHVLAADVTSAVSLPLFTQSAVDGYALRQQDVDAGIREFELIGEIRAGIEQSFELQQGQALRIFTGGKLPHSADTVARQEIVSRQQNRISLNNTISLGADIRYQGEELQQGTLLAEKGQQLTVGLIAALSMAGVKQVQVYKSPKIAVLITGDEVSQTQQLDNQAQVFDANSPLISSWLQQHGYHSVVIQHVIDDEQILKRALEQSLQHFDVVLTTGGVSVGDYDLIRPVSLALGAQEIFWQVAQKPGKPLYFASYQQLGSKHRSYLLGLPGNPAAVLIGLYVHVHSLLNCLQQQQHPLPQWQTGVLQQSLKTDSREQLLRMQVSSNSLGQLLLSPLNKQQSHMLSNMAKANALVRVPAGLSTKSGDPLTFVYI